VSLHDPLTGFRLKDLPSDRMVDTVRYVTSGAIFSLFCYGVRPTATCYRKTFHVKLPYSYLDRSGLRLSCSLFRYISLYWSLVSFQHFCTAFRCFLHGWHTKKKMGKGCCSVTSITNCQ